MGKLRGRRVRKVQGGMKAKKVRALESGLAGWMVGRAAPLVSGSSSGLFPIGRPGDRGLL